MPVCQRGLRTNVLACQRGVRANVPEACQVLNFTCQRAKQRVSFSNYRANVPEGIPIYTLLLCKKFSPNTGNYGPEISPHLDTFHAVTAFKTLCAIHLFIIS